MRVIKVDKEGVVSEQSGKADFWMDPDVIWASESYPEEKGHYVYYDDDAMVDPGQIRLKVKTLEVPLPIWITGSEGERTAAATLSVEKVRRDLRISG